MWHRDLASSPVRAQARPREPASPLHSPGPVAQRASELAIRFGFGGAQRAGAQRAAAQRTASSLCPVSGVRQIFFLKLWALTWGG